MHPEIMHPIHAFVHHELHGEDRCLTWFEYHRTDGRSGWSAPFQYFDIWSFGKTEGLVTHIL